MKDNILEDGHGKKRLTVTHLDPTGRTGGSLAILAHQMAIGAYWDWTCPRDLQADRALNIVFQLVNYFKLLFQRINFFFSLNSLPFNAFQLLPQPVYFLFIVIY